MRFLLLMKYKTGVVASSPIPTLRRNKELFVHLREQHTTAAVSPLIFLDKLINCLHLCVGNLLGWICTHPVDTFGWKVLWPVKYHYRHIGYLDVSIIHNGIFTLVSIYTVSDSVINLNII